MQSGDALPPEIYRLDAHRLPGAQGRARRRASVTLAVAAAAATGIVAAGTPTLRAALDTALGVGAIAAAVAAYALWAAGRSVRRSWNAFELAIGPHSLRVAAPGRSRAAVQRMEVVRIVERANGLIVRSSASGASVRVPPDIENYTDIRARLATWSPIVRRRDPRLIIGGVVLAAACAGGAFLALTAALPEIAVAGLVFVTAVGVLAAVDVVLRPAVQPMTKIVEAAVIGTGLFDLLAHVLRRAG